MLKETTTGDWSWAGGDGREAPRDSLHFYVDLVVPVSVVSSSLDESWEFKRLRSRWRR